MREQGLGPALLPRLSKFISFVRERTELGGIESATEGHGALDDNRGNLSLSWIRNRAKAGMVRMVCKYLSNSSRSSDFGKADVTDMGQG
jgi:hypothetical protein